MHLLVGGSARPPGTSGPHEAFDRAIGCANDVGLLADEADPATGAALGNFAQAFSHLALIHAAVRLAEAGRKTDVTREQRRDGWQRRLLAGAAAGIGATVPMTAVMAAAQRAGWLNELPPETITAAAADAADVELDEPELHGLSALNHLAFGASCGAGFAVLARRVPPGPPRVATGAAFGIIVWLASYQGWLPALDVLPPASRDHSGRRRTMFAAHVVYGATLGALLRS